MFTRTHRWVNYDQGLQQDFFLKYVDAKDAGKYAEFVEICAKNMQHICGIYIRAVANGEQNGDLMTALICDLSEKTI